MAAPVKSATQDQFSARKITLSLLSYCRERDWAGWDPYDALKSKIFKQLPFLDSRAPRLALTQTLKRAPFNLRRLLLVPPTQNPKGLALFLQALLKLGRLGLVEEKQVCASLVRRIAELRTPNTEKWSWGYSFPWQTRNRLVPEGAANLVCTTFVAEALLDYHEASGDQESLDMALSAAEYIAEELYFEQDDVASFSYPFPASRVPVHNANFLAAALLGRVSGRDDWFLQRALKVARYSAGKQETNGSWVYGEAPSQAWIDNFHTGFNLCALKRIGKFLQTDEFIPHLKRGYAFYRQHFFEPDGAPKYYHNRTYPLDVHSAAQSLITLVELQDIGRGSEHLCEKVLNWTLTHLWDDEGYFYYQKRAWGRIKIPYMRWGQAWMLLALATVLEGNDASRRQIAGKVPAPQTELSGALR